MAKKQTEETQIRERLESFAHLQVVLSKIDSIRKLRGDLPAEVETIERDLERIQTQLDNESNKANICTQGVKDLRVKISEARELIDRYESQLNKVRNNREYDNLSKEIEFQNLEIQHSEKKIENYTRDLEILKNNIEEKKEKYKLRSEDLKAKTDELDKIIKTTEKEEKTLTTLAEKVEKKISDDRLLLAFKKIRNAAHNGLAIVPIERDACGGCFNRIPPQYQMEIQLSKKITVCEYCGRIIIDPEIMKEAKEKAK